MVPSSLVRVIQTALGLNGRAPGVVGGILRMQQPSAPWMTLIPPRSTNLPDLEKYHGTTDPDNHAWVFEKKMRWMGYDDVALVRAFLQSL